MKRIIMLVVVAFAIMLSGCAAGEVVKDVAGEVVKDVVVAEVKKEVAPVVETVKTASELVENSKAWFAARQSLWDKYKNADLVVDGISASVKATLQSKVDAQTRKLIAAKDLVEFGDKELKSKTEGILAWQYQNLGYLYIKEVKALTTYDARMAKIEALDKEQKWVEKKDYIEKTKAILIEENPLLEKAAQNMVTASSIHNAMETKDNDYSLRAKRIEANLSWIDWVQNFIK